MFATRRTLGRTARIVLVTLPFAAMACGGDKSSTIRSAEARSVEPTTTPVSNVSTVSSPAPALVHGTLTDVAFERGDDAFKAGNFREAVRLFKLEGQTKPTDGRTFYMLGLSSWKGGDFEGAKVAFDKSIELDSGYSKSYFNSARLLLDMKRPSEALERIVQGLTVDSASPDGLRLKARAQSENGDVTGAYQTYRAMLIKDDQDAWGLNNYGMFLLQHNCVSEALGPLARAVQVRPNAPLFLNNFGMVLEKAGYDETALYYFEEAVRHDSSFTKAVKNAARVKAKVEADTSRVVPVIDVTATAEQFRQLVKEWKAGLQPAVKDSVPPAI
jgi:Flp pilus assembly protein TadD